MYWHSLCKLSRGLIFIGSVRNVDYFNERRFVKRNNDFPLLTDALLNVDFGGPVGGRSFLSGGAVCRTPSLLVEFHLPNYAPIRQTPHDHQSSFMRYSSPYSGRPLECRFAVANFNLARYQALALELTIALDEDSTPPACMFSTEPHSQSGDVGSFKGPDLFNCFVGTSADVIFAVGHKALRRGRTAPTNAAPPEGIINLSADNFILSRTKSFARVK
jgi:hypothetical protein